MSHTEKRAITILLLLIGASAVMHILAGYAGDKGWLLLTADMMLAGRRLYVDVVEVNPPLILWFDTTAAWLSHHLPWKDYNLLALIGLGMSVLSAWLGARLIRLHPAFAGQTMKPNLFGLGLLSLFVFFTRPSYFIDREHILFVCTLPYLLRFMPSLARQKLPLAMRALIGVMAAFGFCMKPHTAVVFVMLQLLYIARERSLALLWSVENMLIYTLSFIYLLAVWHFTPEYIHEVLPMAMATYWAFSRPLIGMLYAIMAFMMAGLALVDFRPRFVTPYRPDTYYFIGACVAFLAYALVGNGWGYTYHPLLCMILLLTAWIYTEYDWLIRDAKSHGNPVKQFIYGERACATSILCNAGYMVFGLVTFFTSTSCERDADCPKTLPYVQYMQQHDLHSFGALSEDYHKWTELSRLSGASFDTRYNALWMVPAFVVRDEKFAAAHQWIIDRVARNLAYDLNHRKPPIVFVDDPKRFFGTEHDVFLPDIFLGVAEFKEAWGHYRYTTTLDTCDTGKPGNSRFAVGCRYVIYNRVP